MILIIIILQYRAKGEKPMPKKQLFMLTTILIVAVLLNFTCTG